jgi:hypothetical protein
MLRSRWFLAFLSILVLIACTSGRPFQQRTPEGGAVFPNGFTVNGEFLKIYQSADNPALIFGLPISGVLKHPLRPGVQVQYFQRARMEYDASAPEGHQVSLATLGNWLYDATKRGADANIDTSSAACRYFESTRHYVCFAFLQFFDAHKGAVFFGDPISEVEIDGERMVQYFQQARMEWWPERAAGMRVDLTDVGTLDYREKFGDPQPPQPGNIGNVNSPDRLIVRVFPAKPLLGSHETQTVFVIVQNQLFNPVEGADVTLTVQLPDGTIINTTGPVKSDANGICKWENISVGNSKPNEMALVKASVKMKDLQPVESSTWFRIWW